MNLPHPTEAVDEPPNPALLFDDVELHHAELDETCDAEAAGRRRGGPGARKGLAEQGRHVVFLGFRDGGHRRHGVPP